MEFLYPALQALGTPGSPDAIQLEPGRDQRVPPGGPLWAILVLLLDLGRASSLAYIALQLLPPESLPWCALFLLLGNMYPVFHGFKGGKGVANYLGFTLLPAPFFAMAAAAVWVMIFTISRQPFIGSFGMITVLALGLAWRSGFSLPAVLGALVNAGLIVYAHRRNLEDLLSKRR